MAGAARSSRDKVRAHRERLRAQGLRPVQVWIPDTRTPAFAEEVRRQCLLVKESAQEAEDIAFVDAASADLFRSLPDEDFGL